MIRKLGRRIFAIAVLSLVGFGFYSIYTLYMQSPIMDEFRVAESYFEEGEYAKASDGVESILERKPYQRATLQLKQKLFVEKTVAETFAKGDELIAEARVCTKEGNYTCANNLYADAYEAYSRLPYGSTDEHIKRSEEYLNNLLVEYSLIEYNLSNELVAKARAKAGRDRMEAYYFLAGAKINTREITLYKSSLAYDVAHTRMSQLNQRIARGQGSNAFLIDEISLWLGRVDETSPQFDAAQQQLKELQR